MKKSLDLFLFGAFKAAINSVDWFIIFAAANLDSVDGSGQAAGWPMLRKPPGNSNCVCV